MSLRTRNIVSVVQDLAKEGLISSEQLASAMEQNTKEMQATPNEQKTLMDLGEYLVTQGYLTEKDFNNRLARKAGIRALSLTDHQPDFAALKSVHPNQINKWRVLPIVDPKGRFTIATADPFDLAILDEVKAEFGRPFDCVLASKSEIETALRYFLTGEKPPEVKVQTQTPEGEEQDGENQEGEVSILTKEVEKDPVPDYQMPEPTLRKATIEKESKLTDTIGIVDQMFNAAVNERASDIHLEPTREGLKIRFRVDGILELHKTFPVSMQSAILSRLKIIGGMDVAEQRIPQDGRTTLTIDGKNIDLRIASYPTLFGEAAAVRMLSKNLITLDDLGFNAQNRDAIEYIIHRPYGIFLVTGPTGSGKTTTLYAGLQRIDRNKHHVLSAEDPVENEIEGVAQTQINVKAGVTFAAALRSMLRQDPDVIMLGEIRDQETADIALRAAMTGHLVLSTLHTNTAIGAVARLVDLGVETYLISSTLLGVIAQRLVRCICQHCKEPSAIPPEAVRILGPKSQGMKAFKGKGCTQCNMRGYSGRIGIYELIKVDEEFRVLINTHAPEVRLKEKAAAAGFNTMIEDGIDKINRGITTVEEVLKVCGVN